MSDGSKNQRADAQRNRQVIIDAAITALAENPQASVSEIAQRAKVGRVTLYGHFESRDELLNAVARQVMQEVESELGMIERAGAPLATLESIAESSWRLIDRFQGVVSAMNRGAGGGTSRGDHDHLLTQVQHLIHAGQKSGEIRTDQSAAWLASCFYSVLHNAGAENRAGSITEAEIARAVPQTVRAMLKG